MVMRKSGEPRSLSRMATEAAEDESGGIQCPKCHCRDFKAYRTSRYEATSVTFRYKRCRHCGHRVLTSTESREKIIRDIDSQDDQPSGGVIKFAS